MASRATNANKQAGTEAEEWAERQYNGERTPNAWFDVDGSDSILEVKSTRRTLSSGRRGRFRLWFDQHQNLQDHSGEYVFVLTEEPLYPTNDTDDSKITEDGRLKQSVVNERIKNGATARLDPDRIDEIMNRESLEWAGSGNHVQRTRQLKLTWKHIDELAEQMD
jgi:hypothetical protein